MSKPWLNLRFRTWEVLWGPNTLWPRLLRAPWVPGLRPFAIYAVRGPGWLVVIAAVILALLLGWHALSFDLRELRDL